MFSALTPVEIEALLLSLKVAVVAVAAALPLAEVYEGLYNSDKS